MQAALINEERIVWLMDTNAMPYVREGVYLTTQRRTRPRPPGARGNVLVGYAEVGKKGSGIQVYERRVFWLKPHDRYFDPNGVYRVRMPAEAVRPQDVRVSSLTPRRRLEKDNG
jgi:hypothetical protein